MKRHWILALALLFLALPAAAERAEDCAPLDAAAAAASLEDAQVTEQGRPQILLIVPKGPDGKLLSEGLELAPGARVIASRWSPVLCATVARVEGPEGTAPTALISRLPDSAVAVPDDEYTTAATPGAATDPYRGLQYALDQIGVDAAHELTRGAGARVGILDSPPDITHPDLEQVELAPMSGVQSRAASHGTRVAGVIAAGRGNGVGITGVAPEAHVLAIPACHAAEGTGQPDRCRLYDVIEGFDLAWQRDVHVLNLSLIGPPNPALERGAKRLGELGMLLVAAAGNDGSDAPRYPAAYPTVIGVGAVDRDGRDFERGNRGVAVEIRAPGVEIVTTVPGGGFAFGDGTGLATAHVSGVLALLVAASRDPAGARLALFQAGHAMPTATSSAALAPVCNSLARLGKPCRN